MSQGISVVIPAYNAARWLPRALASVQTQTLPVAEIIVVNDGSTDATAQVARKSSLSMRYVVQSNAGVSAARNRGIAEARHAWLAFLDADDEWLPHKLQRQMAILAADPQLRWCVSAYADVRDGTPPDTDAAARVARVLAGRTRLSFFEAAGCELPLQTSGFVIQRAVLAEVGGFKPALRMSEDRDLWCRIALRYPILGYCAEVCYRYFVDTPASLMKGRPERTAAVCSLCDIMPGAQRSGPTVAAAYYAYAHRMVNDYLVRAAGREVVVAPPAVHDARRLFPPTVYQRLVMAGLACLPAGLARRVLRRVSL